MLCTNTTLYGAFDSAFSMLLYLNCGSLTVRMMMTMTIVVVVVAVVVIMMTMMTLLDLYCSKIVQNNFLILKQ